MRKQEVFIGPVSCDPLSLVVECKDLLWSLRINGTSFTGGIILVDVVPEMNDIVDIVLSCSVAVRVEEP